MEKALDEYQELMYLMLEDPYYNDLSESQKNEITRKSFDKILEVMELRTCQLADDVQNPKVKEGKTS